MGVPCMGLYQGGMRGHGRGRALANKVNLFVVLLNGAHKRGLAGIPMTQFNFLVGFGYGYWPTGSFLVEGLERLCTAS